MNMRIWIVGFENNKWWCANRDPYPPTTYQQAIEYAMREATLLMMKHPIKRDMSKARVIFCPELLSMRIINAPEYIDYSSIRNTPRHCSVVEAPSRYQAIKIVKEGIHTNELSNCTINTREPKR